MTSRTTFSLPDLGGRRAEFVDFYRATYPVVAGELLAMTGSAYVAHVTAGVSYTRAWQAWPSLRTTEWPAMWVRADAFRRVGRPLPARGAPPIAPLQLEPEDQVLVTALQRLPAGQRRSVVLHYMARLPVDTIVEWFGGTVAQVDGDLDAGFAALVGVLDWSDDPMDETGDPIAGDAYDWTAEALEESAQRLQRCIPSPPPTLTSWRTAAQRVARRGAPASAAAAAACVGLVVYLSPAPASPTAAYAAPPPVATQPSEPVEGGVSAPGAETPADATAPGFAALVKPVAAYQASVAPRLGPSLAVAAGSAVERTIATTTGGTTTPPATASPAGTTTSFTTSTTTASTTTAATSATSTSPATTSASGSTAGTGSGSTAGTTTGSTTPTNTTSPTSSTRPSTPRTSASESEASDPGTSESTTTNSQTEEPDTNSATSNPTTVTSTATKTATDTPEPVETRTGAPTESASTEPAETTAAAAEADDPGIAAGQVTATSPLKTEVLVGSTTRADDGG